MGWSEYEERYGESREDFIDVEEAEVDRCVYCGSSDNIIRRKYRIFNRPKTELICTECLSEELEYESEVQEPVLHV